MQYWLPNLALPDQLLKQTGLLPKLGGLPWGFPPEKWPFCEECGNPMHMVAQLPEEVPGPIVEEGLVFHLFRCCWSSSCDLASSSDNPKDGKEAIVLQKSEILHGLTRPPLTKEFIARLNVQDGLSAYEVSSARGDSMRSKNRERAILPELVISDFTLDDDGVDPALYPDFLSREKFDQLPEDIAIPASFDSKFDTKIGGLPYWGGNGVMESGLEGAIFLFSIGGFVYPSEGIPKNYLSFDQGGDDGALVDVADGLDGSSYGIFHDFNYQAALMVFRLPNGQILQTLAQ